MTVFVSHLAAASIMGTTYHGSAMRPGASNAIRPEESKDAKEKQKQPHHRQQSMGGKGQRSNSSASGSDFDDAATPVEPAASKERAPAKAPIVPAAAVQSVAALVDAKSSNTEPKIQTWCSSREMYEQGFRGKGRGKG